MKIFKISPSNIHRIMTGNVGLSDAQQKEYDKLISRKNDASAKALTEIMEKDLAELIKKKENPQLPDGVKSYLQQWYLEKKYDRKKEWFNKFVEKGLQVEDQAIDMLSVHLNGGIQLKKNETYYQNEFIHGFPDVVHEDTVYDTKSAWDIFSFPFFEKESPDPKYDWQLQGYMSIAEKEKAQLVYCLIDTPNALIDLELKKLYYQSGGRAEDWNPETHVALRVNYKFDDIPFEHKIKVYQIKRDEQKINQIFERVKLSRIYIADELETNF